MIRLLTALTAVKKKERMSLLKRSSKERAVRMKVVAMIPIKLNSERLLKKSVKEFSDGTPLMEFIQRACLGAESIHEVYVYCSNPEVHKHVINGVRYLQRPDYLDTVTINCNDIIREFMKVVDADIFVVSHATSPFTRSSSIETCIQKVASSEYDSAFLAKRFQQFLWQDGKALNFDVQHFPRTQDLKPIYAESSGAFVFAKESFLKYNRRIGVKPYIHELDEIEAIDIDYPIDFEIANAIYKEIFNCEYSN
jgi:CMP-N-acetylneuraminic acid synthetase